MGYHPLWATLCQSHPCERTAVILMWHDMWHSFLWVWVQVRGSLCLFWRETPTNGLHARFPTRPEEGRRRQTTEESKRTGQSAGERESSWQKSGEADGQRKVTARTSGPRDRVGQREKMSQRSWWFVEISLEYTLAIAHRCTESYTKVP